MAAPLARLLAWAALAVTGPAPASASAGGLAARGAAAASPLEKVAALLAGLKSEVEAEGKQEAATYDEFACFCKSKTTGLASSITASQDSIDENAAAIEEKAAEKADKSSELMSKKAEKEGLSADLDAKTVRCEKEHADYEASNADLSEAISSLERAIAALREAGTTSGLLAVQQTVKKSLALAEAMQLVEEGPHWPSAAVALLQQGSRVDPDGAEYKHHSQGLIALMDGLLHTFRQQKAEADAEWTKTKDTCDLQKANLNTDLNLAAEAISTFQAGIETLTSQIGSARREVVETQDQLREDDVYLQDLTKMCEQRAVDWDQRSSMRAQELKALGQALDLLSTKVTETEGVSGQALLLQPSPAGPPAFLDEATNVGTEGPADVSAVLAGPAASFLQRGLLSRVRQGRGHRGSSIAPGGSGERSREVRAFALLQREGSRLGSTALSALALAAAADPFGKVKPLIQRLIERLTEEATTEATKKGFCEAELAKAEQDRDFRWGEVVSLNAALESLDAKQDALSTEVAELSESIQSLAADAEEAARIRGEEKAVNLATIEKSKGGYSAVSEAILVLKSFYAQAGRAKVSLLQESVRGASPDPAGPGLEGAYQGKRAASEGIIAILGVVKSDFQRAVQAATQAEADSLAKFVEFDHASRADLAAQATKRAYGEEDLETARRALAITTADLGSSMGMVDSALRQLELLRPGCAEAAEASPAERAGRRGEEVAALRKALCLLDEEGAEPQCGG